MLNRYPSYKFALLFLDIAVLNLSIFAALWVRELSGWYGGSSPFSWNKFVFMNILSLVS